jgi:ProP effector
MNALPDFDGSVIGGALQFYTRDIRYQRSLAEGTQRIDLAGNVAGIVTAAQAENAERVIAGIEAKLAQRQEQRAPHQHHPHHPHRRDCRWPI